MIPCIEVHIEELVLDGFAPGDRSQIAKALRRELLLRLAQGEIPRILERDAQIQVLDAGVVDINPNTRAEKIGARVGQAVRSVLSQPTCLEGDKSPKLGTDP
jgi:hypothetical protein